MTCQTTIFKAFNISSSASFYVLRQNLYTTDYLQNISCLWKPQVISGGHWTLLLDPPLLRPRRKHWQSFERVRVSVFTCRTLNPNFTWSQAMHWRQYTQTDQSCAHESRDGSWGYNLNRFNVKYLPGYQNIVILNHTYFKKKDIKTVPRQRPFTKNLFLSIRMLMLLILFYHIWLKIVWIGYFVIAGSANKWYLIRMCISWLVLWVTFDAVSGSELVLIRYAVSVVLSYLSYIQGEFTFYRTYVINHIKIHDAGKKMSVWLRYKL